MPEQEIQQSAVTCPVVAVGASAGGVEAFKELVKYLPVGFGGAVVFVTHLSPSYPSELAPILRHITALPVGEVVAGQVPEAGHIYVAIPNADVLLEKGVFVLNQRPAPQQPHFPINLFFESLARDRKSLAVGIILSGTGSDGALGIKALKDAGGLCFAQDQTSARWGEMPDHAAAAGADFVLPPQEIAKHLFDLTEGPLKSLASNDERYLTGLDDTAQLAELLQTLNHATGVDFGGYKTTTVRRRIARRMMVHRLESLQAYKELLASKPEEATALLQDMLIHVTSFFRDPEAFQALKKIVFPQLFRSRSNDLPIRVWVPGCASGEEAYSVIIALLEFMAEESLDFEIQIFGTDLSPSAIKSAQRGRYSKAEVEGLSDERLRQFFVKNDDGYIIKKHIRDRMVFAIHNIAKDTPFSQIDLICCRNLLIYLGLPLQAQIMAMFHFALRPQGYLMLGSAEAPSERSGLFSCIDKVARIFSRADSSAHGYADDLVRRYYSNGMYLGRPKSMGISGECNEPVLKQADDLLVNQLAPAGFLVNESLRIIRFHGDTSLFVSPSPGAPSPNLMDMLRPELRYDVRIAFKELIRTGEASSRDVQLENQGTKTKYCVRCFPVSGTSSEGRFSLITFANASGANDNSGHRPIQKMSRPSWFRFWAKAKDSNLEQHGREIEILRTELRSLVEQGSAAEEELRSSNEEILSANEELQSTNEELEVAKEELQSRNEEMQTVNDELSLRNHELSLTLDKLSNLVQSSQIPVVMLDRDLNIRLLTPAAERAFKFQANDIGRHLSDFNLGFPVDLAEIATSVVATAQQIERRFKSVDGFWYSLKASPFWTLDRRVDGAVLAFFDVSAILTDLNQKSLTFADRIVQTIREPLLVLDSSFQIVMANKSFYTTFHINEVETLGRQLFDLGNGQWDLPDLRQLLTEVLPLKKTVEDFEISDIFDKIGQRYISLNAREIMEEHAPSLILVAMEDTTDKRREQEAMKLILEYSPAGMIMVDGPGNIVFTNHKVEEIFGYQANELVGINIEHLMTPDVRDEHRLHHQKYMESPTKRPMGSGRAIPARHKTGRDLTLEISLAPIQHHGETLVVAGILDLSDRKKVEESERATAISDLANQAKSRFLASVSHEIRTPLTAIIGFSDLLTHEEDSSPAVAHYAASIKRNGAHLKALIDDVLDLSKIEAGQLELDIGPVNLEEEISIVLAAVEIKAQSQGIELRIERRPNLPQTLITDPMRLRQILINLLGNAIKFTQSGEVVLTIETIQTHSDDSSKQRLVFTIRDTGCGIAQDHHEMIFSPFCQATTAVSSLFGGTGLGLALSLKLARLLGGDLELVASDPGKGSTFAFWIEHSVSQESLGSQVAQKLSGQIPKPHWAAVLKGAKLLVVEDSLDIQEIVRQVLRRAGAEVETQDNGKAAVEAAGQRTFDAILMDMQMPIMDGYEATRSLRRLGIKTPILALTAHATKEEREQCLAAGCDDYRSKPIRPEDLVTLLGKWCKR